MNNFSNSSFRGSAEGLTKFNLYKKYSDFAMIKIICRLMSLGYNMPLKGSAQVFLASLSPFFHRSRIPPAEHGEGSDPFKAVEYPSRLKTVPYIKPS